MSEQMVIPDTAYIVSDTDVWEACYSANRPLSRLEIARRVSRKVTPSLVARIEGLVSKGHLERAITYKPNGAVKFLYTAVEA